MNYLQVIVHKGSHIQTHIGSHTHTHTHTHTPNTFILTNTHARGQT